MISPVLKTKGLDFLSEVKTRDTRLRRGSLGFVRKNTSKVMTGKAVEELGVIFYKAFLPKP